jgi:hypothetical protein
VNCADFTGEDVDKKLREALKRLLSDDSYLLKNDVNERSISHRFAMYLQRLFDGWHVDCEYNKDHDDTKKISFPKEVATNDTDAKTVYPDIIIHKRGTSENFVVIEVKKSTNRDGNNYDKQKLKAFKDDLGYCYAVALTLKTGSTGSGENEEPYNIEFI